MNNLADLFSKLGGGKIHFIVQNACRLGYIAWVIFWIIFYAPISLEKLFLLQVITDVNEVHDKIVELKITEDDAALAKKNLQEAEQIISTEAPVVS